MSLDPTTESIAHFIGLFHLAEEEARLRKEYYEFKMKEKEVETNDLAFAPVETKAPYKSRDYDPHSRLKPQPEPLPPIEEIGLPSFGVPSFAPGPAGLDFHPPAAPSAPLGPGGPNFGPSIITILPYVPIPSSAITITYQSIWLSDDDVLGDIDAAGFQPLEIFHEALGQAIELAEALQPWSTDGLTAQFIADPSSALTFLDLINSVEAPQINGVTVSVFSDEEAEGIHVNGVLVDEAPELDDQLPQFIQDKRDKLADEEAEDQLAGHEKDAALLGRDDDEYATVTNGEHNVSAGANETHNTVDIHTSWIDAGVIAVAGDVIDLNAVSQVNILSDTDQYENPAWRDPSAPSQAHNIAAIESASREIPDGFQIKADAGTDLPESWEIEYLDGDVIVTNFVKQHTFVTDTDRLELTFSANSTSIVTGENQTYNYTHAGEFGFGYDLIFVGGTMLSMNLVSQTNVLMDSDIFSGAGLAEAALSGNDNVLRNEVDIMKEGVDTQVKMLKEFKTALKDLKNGAKELSESVTQSKYFEGLEQLRILYIEGDLTQMNIVDQVNYLGDQDQVHMAMDAVSSALDDVPVAITTGSNLMTNTAQILETGFDSDVMVSGDYYSDALLYQAELIDTDADPTGVGISALASEAVAFLADDLIPDSVSETLESAGHNNDAHTGGTALDVMQTMTA